MNPVSFDNSVRNHLSNTVSAPPPAQLAEQRQLIKAVKTLNRSEYFGENNELTFQQDADTGRPVIRIRDKQTHEVVSQIPAEYILEAAEKLKETAENTR